MCKHRLFFFIAQSSISSPLGGASLTLCEAQAAQLARGLALNDFQTCTCPLSHLFHLVKHKGKAPWAIEDDRKMLFDQQILRACLKDVM